MANFVIVIDCDRERGGRFVKTIKPLLGPVEGLVTGECSSGDFGSVWASSEQAPVSQVVNAAGAAYSRYTCRSFTLTPRAATTEGWDS